MELPFQESLNLDLVHPMVIFPYKKTEALLLYKLYVNCCITLLSNEDGHVTCNLLQSNCGTAIQQDTINT